MPRTITRLAGERRKTDRRKGAFVAAMGGSRSTIWPLFKQPIK